MSINYSPNIVDDGLVLYLDAANNKSYPGSGLIWYDLSGNNINGTLSTSVMGTSTYGSMRLNNSTDSLSFGHNILLEPPNITIGAWINLLDRGDRHILLTKWVGWSFEISSSRYPYFRVRGTNINDITSTIPITWGNWHYISSTFDDVNNIRHIYIDGVLTNSINDTGSITYSQSSFNIPYSNNPIHAYGKISMVHIYSKPLTSLEISQNYNALKGRYV